MVENQCYYLEYYRLKEVWCARGITIICCQTTRSCHFQVHQVSVPEFCLQIIWREKKELQWLCVVGKILLVFWFPRKVNERCLSVHSRTICTSVLHSILIVLSVVFGLTSFLTHLERIDSNIKYLKICIIVQNASIWKIVRDSSKS